jgi:hypothetical protein
MVPCSTRPDDQAMLWRSPSTRRSSRVALAVCVIFASWQSVAQVRQEVPTAVREFAALTAYPALCSWFGKGSGEISIPTAQDVDKAVQRAMDSAGLDVTDRAVRRALRAAVKQMKAAYRRMLPGDQFRWCSTLTKKIAEAQ